MRFLCFNAELHVTVNNTKILSGAQKFFYGNLCHRQQCKLYVPVFERNIFQLIYTIFKRYT